MPSMSVRVVGLTDPPPFEDVPVLVHYGGSSLELVVLNGGMESGDPSVCLAARTEDGLILIETSLLAFQAGARAAVGMAETHFGWTMPP